MQCRSCSPPPHKQNRHPYLCHNLVESPVQYAVPQLAQPSQPVKATRGHIHIAQVKVCQLRQGPAAKTREKTRRIGGGGGARRASLCCGSVCWSASSALSVVMQGWATCLRLEGCSACAALTLTLQLTAAPGSRSSLQANTQHTRVNGTAQRNSQSSSRRQRSSTGR
jgi:hypothetical protein